MFVAGGENIQPESIEHVLLAIPGIMQALVLPEPHPEIGTTPVAFVEDQERRGGTELAPILLEVLPKFQVPRHFLPWPASIAGAGMKPSRRAFTAEAIRLLEGS
jgi:O-succinylbenzoic acid--CoA ligase